MICVQGQCQNAVEGQMGLVEVEGELPTADGGTEPAKLIEGLASFHSSLTHDYDDRIQGVGCTGDHYEAQTKPLPPDDDAGWLRISGFAGGTLRSGASAGQPIVCMLTNGYYICSFPTGASVTGPPFASFPDTANPLGDGTVLLATQGGTAFGPKTLSGSAMGTLSVMEPLNSISYSMTGPTTLHVSCSDGCPSARVAVELIAVSQAKLGTGWPFPSVGITDCLLPSAGSVSISAGAVAAMFAQDASLDTVWTSVIRLPATPPATADRNGNPLVGEIGRGVFGVAPR